MLDLYNKNRNVYELQINSINKEIDFYKDKSYINNNINKYKKIYKLDKFILDEFIDKIYVCELEKIKNTRNIVIEWNFH